MMGGLGGDIGARDPTAGEIGSNFGTSTLGHADTDHIVKATGKLVEALQQQHQRRNNNTTTKNRESGVIVGVRNDNSSDSSLNYLSLIHI